MKLAALMCMGLAACSGAARADTPLVGYECDRAHHRLTVTYRLAQDDGAQVNGPREWNPWNLETVDDDGAVGNFRTVGGSCRLGRHVYVVTIGPLPGNSKTTRTCGAEVSAWAEVRRDAAVVLPRHEFEGFCQAQASVTTRVDVVDGVAPRIIEVPYAEFHGSTAP